MAFDITTHLGYGDGSNGDLTAGTDQIINNYAQVYYVAGKTVKVRNISGTGIGLFSTVGQEVLFHVSGYTGSAATCNVRGQWVFCKISAISGDLITLSKTVSSAIGSFSIDDLYVQLITVPHFKTLTINSGKSITCPQFNYTSGTGGIVAFKCSNRLKFNGGHIKLENKGMPDNTNWAHGQVKNESDDHWARISNNWQNYRTLKHLTINYPDGAVIFTAKKMTCHEDSKIGNSTDEGDRTHLIAQNSGNATVGKSGGASILIAAETIENWTAGIIRKMPSISYGSGARGASRCYIATETTLPFDECLYAYDRISDPERLAKAFNLTGAIGFGNGSNGTKSNLTKQLNTYAQVISIDNKGKTFKVNIITPEGLATFKKDALVMIHANSRGTVFERAGKFMLTRITSVGVGSLTIADAFDTAIYGDVKNYHIQIIAIPEFLNFTMHNKTNNAALKFDTQKGTGGILALAVSDTCDLTDNGYLAVTEKGGATPYKSKGLNYISNATMCERLPIGEGHGSIFILANNLILDKTSRLGSYQKRELADTEEVGGNYFGGINRSLANYDNHSDARNVPDQSKYYETNGLEITNGNNNIVLKNHGTPGSAAGGGYCPAYDYDMHWGGYGSNASDGACQGAHLLIVANKIIGFNLNAICTGGDGNRQFSAKSPTAKMKLTGEQGGACYGGSGGSIGDWRGGNGGLVGGGGGCSGSAGGGGSGAFCFVYCNEAENYVKSGITYD